MLIIHQAAKIGHITFIKYLLDNGANIYEQNCFYGKNLLHIPAKYNQEKVFHFLSKENLQQVKELVNKQDSSGQTVLHSAAQSGQEELAKWLINNNYAKDLNRLDNYGRTAIHIAIGSSHTEVVRFLVRSKILDVNQQDKKKKNSYAPTY